MRRKRPKIALVLGGGGALGFAHLGVYEALKQNKIPIDLIVGTSMGAVVGGAIAVGKTTEELLPIIENMRTRHLFDVNLTFKGVLSGRGAVKFIKKTIPDIGMKDTKIPFICNAVDLISCKEVILKEGSIINNIRASISCPGVFNPVRKNGMLLVDGGVINNLAHDIARKEGADIIIAVDVVTKTILSKKINNAVSVVVQSMLISQKELQANKPKFYNILIQPDLGEYTQYNFNGEIALDIIERGKKASMEKMNKIKELINDF